MKTIVGLYDDWSTARQVVEELSGSGFHRDHINLVVNDANETHARSLDTADVNTAAEGAATGAVAGGALGGLGGLLLGLGALAIPGIGPVIAAGPIAAGLTGAAVGAATGGLIGALAGWGVPEDEAGFYAEGVRRGGTLVAVQADEHEVDRAMKIMNRFNPVDIEKRTSQWRSSGWTRFDPNAEDYKFNSDTDTTMSKTGNMADQEAISLVQEELHVGKREVDKGTVRAHTYIVETPVQEDVTLREERVTVERRPVDRPADPSMIDAFEERTIEMTETAEEAVVEKTARVVEEVVLGKEVDTRTKRVEDTVRRTEVDIDSSNGNTADMNRYRSVWQKHYNSNFANTNGHDFNYYEPGYRYGYTVANDPRYRGRDWNAIESDVRRDWDTNGQGAWEDFKDTIRYAWNDVKQAVR